MPEYQQVKVHNLFTDRQLKRIKTRLKKVANKLQQKGVQITAEDGYEAVIKRAYAYFKKGIPVVKHEYNSVYSRLGAIDQWCQRKNRKKKKRGKGGKRDRRDFVATNEFLKSYEWKKVRYQALLRSKGRCECCGARPEDGIQLNVDHIKNRKKHPELALVLSNLQVLCGTCNHGKGNWDETDWREPSLKVLMSEGIE